MRDASSFSLHDTNRVAATVPLWLVALVAAAAAPSLVKLYASTLEKRARLRTERALAGARRDTDGEEQAKRTPG
jgi:hypothetical protein